MESDLKPSESYWYEISWRRRYIDAVESRPVVEALPAHGIETREQTFDLVIVQVQHSIHGNRKPFRGTAVEPEGLRRIVIKDRQVHRNDLIALDPVVCRCKPSGGRAKRGRLRSDHAFGES